MGWENLGNIVATGVIVINGSGQTVASIDSNGNISGQTISAANDVLIGGVSVTQSLEDAAQGFVNRGWVNMSGASWPTTAIGTTETSLFELDVTVPVGRSYMIMLGAYRVDCSAAGTLTINIHYTTDGTVPSTSSNIFFNGVVVQSTATMTPEWVGFYNNTGSSPVTLRLLVSGFVSAGTFQFHPSGGNVNTFGLDILDVGDITTATAGNNAVQFGTGGGGGSTPQNYTTSWNAQTTYAYEGTNGDSSPPPGFSPGALINTNGNAFQGDDQLGDNGNTSTFIVWPAAVATALSGATINSVTITLNNNHSWYDSGMNYNLGYTTATPGGGSRPSITNPNIVALSTAEGAVHAYQISNVSSAFGTALAAGHAFVLYNPTSTRQSYGYAAGAGQSGPPKITVSYTK